MTTSDHGGDHGGAMDKLKSVWRDAVGSREDDETRADGSAARPAPSGTAHPADARPDVSARNASGMQPTGDGGDPIDQQRQAAPGAVPRQQQAPAPQAQPVGAGAVGHGAPPRGAAQAPPAPAPDDRGSEHAPRQAVPQQPAPQQTAPPQAAPAQPAPQQPSAPRPGGAAPQGREPVRGPEGRAAATDEPGARQEPTTGAGDGGAARGRHELFDKAGPASAGAAGAAAAGTASAGARTGADTGADTGAAPDGRAAPSTREGNDGTTPATAPPEGAQDVPTDPQKFVPAERAKAFAARWGEVKGDFIDEPRDAVRKADALVGDVLDEIAKVFTEQRSRLERDLDTDGTSTEDLRQAMHRYREFFERLLTI